MAEKKEGKICGWCGKKIENGNYFMVWKEGKCVGIYCKKCWFEDKKLDEKLREMFAQS